MTGLTKTVVCVILFLGWCIEKNPVAEVSCVRGGGGGGGGGSNLPCTFMVSSSPITSKLLSAY